MKCFVCGNQMLSFMKKNYELDELKLCEYVRCEDCGLVIAETLYEMSSKDWQNLNFKCHSAYQHTNSLDIDPNWLSRLKTQAKLLVDLMKFNILNIQERAVDYGAGDGKLSDYITNMIHENWLKKFDLYMANENYLSVEELKTESFDFVISCSVFEHLIGMQNMDRILNLLKPNGVFALHTLICEEVPRDPNWFYLQPVHATFWTNMAMKKIFKQYNFKACAYNIEARLWLMFRDCEKFFLLKNQVKEVSKIWKFSSDFIDYWKCKPYRS